MYIYDIFFKYVSYYITDRYVEISFLIYFKLHFVWDCPLKLNSENSFNILLSFFKMFGKRCLQ